MSSSHHADQPKRFKPQPVEVLHQDESIIVVNAPTAVWLDIEPFDSPCILTQLTEQGILSEDATLYEAVPLDPEAGGIAVLARSEAVAAQLREQVAGGAFELCYHALVRGFMSKESGRLDNKLAPAGRQGSMTVADEKKGESAVTEWRIRDTFVGFALLECFPRTCLLQQVRAHLQLADLPLAVDRAYGGAQKLMLSSFKAGYRPSRKHKERPLIQRPSIHASSVRFKHPGTGEALNFEAPYPKDFRATLHQLDRFGRMPKS